MTRPHPLSRDEIVLSKDQIRAADDRRLTEVEVPEWGGSVFVRTLPLSERLDLSAAAKRDGDLTIDLVVLCACDPDGGRLFATEDADWLAGKNGEVLQRIALVAIEVNGLTAKATEDAAKNSGASR